MNGYLILAADDLPPGADLNGFALGAHMICTRHDDGKVVVEWNGADTMRDALSLKQLLEHRDAELAAMETSSALYG